MATIQSCIDRAEDSIVRVANVATHVTAIENAVGEETNALVTGILAQTQRNKVLIECLAIRQRQKDELSAKIQQTKKVLSAYESHLVQRQNFAKRLRDDNDVIRMCIQLLQEKLESTQQKHSEEENHHNELIRKYQAVFDRQYVVYEQIPEMKQLMVHRRQLLQAEHHDMVKESELKQSQYTVRQVQFNREHSFSKPSDIFVDIHCTGMTSSARLKLNTESIRMQVSQWFQARRPIQADPIPTQDQHQPTGPAVPMMTEMSNSGADHDGDNQAPQFGIQQSARGLDEVPAMESHTETPDSRMRNTSTPVCSETHQQNTPMTPKRQSLSSRFAARAFKSPIVDLGREVAPSERTSVPSASVQDRDVLASGSQVAIVASTPQTVVPPQQPVAELAPRPETIVPEMPPPSPAPSPAQTVAPLTPARERPLGRTYTRLSWGKQNTQPGSPFQLGLSNVEFDFAAAFNNIDNPVTNVPSTCDPGSSFKRPLSLPPRVLSKASNKSSFFYEPPQQEQSTSTHFLSAPSSTASSTDSSSFFDRSDQQSAMDCNLFSAAAQDDGAQSGSFLMDPTPASPFFSSSLFGGQKSSGADDQPATKFLF